MIDYVTLLRERDLAVTPQRVQIINILSAHGHISIEDLYSQLKSSFPTISLATVYKNINIMLGKLLLSEVQVPNKKNVYELVKEKHSHVVCSSCDEIVDIALDATNLFALAEQKTHYALNSSNLVFTGLCPKCKLAS
jgi:Fur family transcriptional regulator, peroxide stress response regulator